MTSFKAGLLPNTDHLDQIIKSPGLLPFCGPNGTREQAGLVRPFQADHVELNGFLKGPYQVYLKIERI
ncbi:hypothetical protein MHI18_08790 [Peribacillus sp. FSL H8-0477]|uniref:hypothetical protein n=1 Tax=Peribacillus sp. FSL H8-0477 TaxID=2921388 RepID=UPI0030F94450